MGEGEGAVGIDDTGAFEIAFVEISGGDAFAREGPEESGACFDVLGIDGGGEGVAFLDGCGGGGEFVGRKCGAAGAIDDVDSGFGDSFGERAVCKESDGELFGAFLEDI